MDACQIYIYWIQWMLAFITLLGDLWHMSAFHCSFLINMYHASLGSTESRNIESSALDLHCDLTFSILDQL